MFKANPFPEYVFGIMHTSWIFHILFGLACLFGPLLMSHLSPSQVVQQENLGSSLFIGIFVLPFLYPMMKYIPFLANYKWLCIAPPLALCASIYFAWAIFYLEPPPKDKLYFQIGETKTYKQLKLKLSQIESDPANQENKVAVFELNTEQSKALVTLEKYRQSEWEGFTLDLQDIFEDKSMVSIWIREKD